MMKMIVLYLSLVIFWAALGLDQANAQEQTQQPQNQSQQQQPEQWAQGENIDFTTEPQDAKSQAALSEVRKISANIQNLKKDVITLNKDLRLMEETLLFPSSTKFSVFVTINSGQFFTLESIKFKLDGEFVATEIYSEKQRQALLRGGVQKLYITNLNEGKHTATAFFTGLGPNGRDYKRAATLDFTKAQGSQYLELLISDDQTTQEPVFQFRQW